MINSTIKGKSFAKINLGLQVCGYKDNFHILNTKMVCISLYDTITLSISNKDEIIGMSIPLDDNIMYKALNLVRDKFNIKNYFKIEIEKNIPIQAGLGGGSSNACCILKLVDKLMNLNLTDDDYYYFSSILGSDVLFFKEGKPSFISDRGLDIKNINIPKLKGILIFNDAYFSTKEVFETFRNKKISYSKTYIDNPISNDLEKAIIYFDNYSLVKECLDDLEKENASIFLMSGSGGSVFGLYESDDVLNEAFLKLQNKYQKIYKFESI